MSEFFKGWRRKIGIVTLVMACTLSSAWLRSTSKRDRIDGLIAARFVHGYIVSTNNQVHIIRRFPIPPDHAINSLNLKKLVSWRAEIPDPMYPVLLGRPTYVSGWPVKGVPDCWSEFSVIWRLDGAGFHFGEGRHETWEAWKVQLWTFPYWSIVIPLTLLSAYLLLSKPPVARPKKAVEPDRV